jgi:Fe-S-cluster containining protein
MEPAATDLDCLTCGACCRSAKPDTILVPAEDLQRWRRGGKPDLATGTVPGHFSQRAFAMRPLPGSGFACIHLGTDANPHACGIYPDRGTTCRQFEAGSPQCLEARRRGML